MPLRSRPNGLGCGGRTLDCAGGKWVQADRGALPAQAVLLVGAERDAYLAGEPADDARFVAAPEEARRVAGTLLPDMLSYDPTARRPVPDNTVHFDCLVST